ncbi:hypothetical protein PRUPE_4G103900 [Prunus persica]|uniref:Uncharacterized protein n=1 Tax=Prunus persica TaxID=3760 RepID=A0A251PIG6_PRUPE|nr:hypothetical protein PRUPE_4G103900 [Prunus persica]
MSFSFLCKYDVSVFHGDAKEEGFGLDVRLEVKGTFTAYSPVISDTLLEIGRPMEYMVLNFLCRLTVTAKFVGQCIKARKKGLK